jgi:PAS domain S-box-containing protein
VGDDDLIEAMLDVVVTIDLEGKITRANRAAEELSGFTRSELAQRSITDLFSDGLSGVRTGVRKQVADGHSFQRDESWLHTANGLRIPVSITVSPLVDQHRDVVAIVIVARDIRELRQLLADRDAEIARLRNELEKLRRSL